MELLADCLPCLLGQALNATRKATPNIETHNELTRRAAAILSRSQKYACAPALCRDIHQMVQDTCKNKDPYREDKQQEIDLARQMVPVLLEQMKAVEDPLEFSLHVAAAGNLIDAAVGGKMVPEAFAQEVSMPFARSCLPSFRCALEKAKTIVYIGDNAGEAVFDTILLRQLLPRRMIYAVRDAPVLNDVTEAEARMAGIADYAQVMSSGCAAPGCLLEYCSGAFKQVFERADLVIAKGQGNYEALSQAPRTVYFLLKAKCQVLARHLHVPPQSYVFACSGENGSQSPGM